VNSSVDGGPGKGAVGFFFKACGDGFDSVGEETVVGGVSVDDGETEILLCKIWISIKRKAESRNGNEGEFYMR
jgi:hypothetical protein